MSADAMNYITILTMHIFLITGIKLRRMSTPTCSDAACGQKLIHNIGDVWSIQKKGVRQF